MSYKENLLKKITIDRLAQRVTDSLGAAGSGSKLDREAMRQLLDIAGYTHRRERDLDLYLENGSAEKGRILALDNDLTIYDTTVEDVVVRKSPAVKEMVSIRNVIKILSDKDVVVSRKEDSVKRVRDASLGRLDLTRTAADVADIAIDGAASLEGRYMKGVREALAMFAEMLGYRSPPRVFQAAHHEIIGAFAEKADGEIRFGPAVIYGTADNELKLIDRELSSLKKDDIDYFQAVVKGQATPAARQAPVFEFLKKRVLEEDPLSEITA
ncbi:MAG: hypothetical protein WAM73_12770 [Desulfobacterales bacterium]